MMRQPTQIRILTIIFIVTFILTTGRYALDFVETFKTDTTIVDFSAYWGGSTAYVNGENPYTQHLTSHSYPYLYPPTLAVIMSPLTSWPLLTAQRIWLLINQALLGVALYLSYSILKTKFAIWQFLLWGTIVFGFYAMFTNLKLTQVSGLLFFLTTMSLWCWKRNWKIAAADFLAFAGAIKLIPLGFALFYLRKKEYRLVIYIVLASAIIQLLPDILFRTHVLQDYLLTGFSGASTVNNPQYFASQSFLSFFQRLFYQVDNGVIPTFVSPLSYACGGFLLILSVYMTRSKIDWTDSRRMLVEAGTILLAISLIVPASWTHYFVWVLVMVPALIEWVTDWARSQPLRNICSILVLAFISFLFMSQPFRLARLAGFDFETGPVNSFIEALSTSILFYGALMLMIICIWLLSSSSEPIPSESAYSKGISKDVIQVSEPD